MARHILITGCSSRKRRKLEANLLSMYDDILISEVHKVSQAREALTNNIVHLLLYVLTEKDDDGLDFCREISRPDSDNHTPCIILVDEEGAGHAGLHHGLQHILPLTSSSSELGSLINKICNPMAMRLTPRYYIPETKAIIAQRDRELPTDVLNISSGGLLCEFTTNNIFQVCDPVMISINFTGAGETADLEGIYAVLSSLKIIERNPDFTPLRIRAGFTFIIVPPAVKNKLKTIFAKAGLTAAKSL
ncbi:MAG TPA: PilZ domain-containing protein [Desulfobacterales bacterium]|nr:PilZ domain-containing protein [Desulfobacterales bacterium]